MPADSPSTTTAQARSGELPAAVFWDMDGTLVDTEPYWITAEHGIVEEAGGVWNEEYAHQLVGNDLMVSAQFIRDNSPVELEPVEIIEELLARVIVQVREHVPWRPGARELLTDLHREGVPCGLVTMSWQRFVDPILARLPEGAFATVVTGDRVEYGKPHPEPYLTAAAELGHDPAECLAIEDSNTGAKSAVAAGCTVLCVPNHVPILEGERRVFVDTLDGLDARSLGRLLSATSPA